MIICFNLMLVKSLFFNSLSFSFLHEKAKSFANLVAHGAGAYLRFP